MNRNASERIEALFAAGSRDVTPAPARHVARVLYAPTSADPEISRLCAKVLSDAERQRADRFGAQQDRARFEQRRAFRRFCAATALGDRPTIQEICFRETEKGRPYLPAAPQLWFSFASCQLGVLGAWSSTHRIGVDLEDQTRDVEAVGLARQFFSQAEAEAVEWAGGQDRARTFYRLWSLKEAALKSIGEGLPFGLEAFEFELTPALRVVRAPQEHAGPGQFDAYLVEGTGACAALIVGKRA